MYPRLILLAGYEIEGPVHAQPQGFQQPCSYGIDHMDAPTKEEKDRCCHQNINLTPQSHKACIYVYKANFVFTKFDIILTLQIVLSGRKPDYFGVESNSIILPKTCFTFSSK